LGLYKHSLNLRVAQYLDAVGRDDIAKSVMVVAQELWEVVKEDEQDPERASVETVNRLGQLGVAKERRQKFELKRK